MGGHRFVRVSFVTSLHPSLFMSSEGSWEPILLSFGQEGKNKEVDLRIREIHGGSVPMCIIYERDPLAVKTKLLLDLTEVGFCYLPTPESDLEAARPPSF